MSFPVSVADLQRTNNRSTGSEPEKPDGKRNFQIQLVLYYC